MPIFYSDIQIGKNDLVFPPAQPDFVKIIYKNGILKTIDENGVESNVSPSTSSTFEITTKTEDYSITTNDNTVLCNCSSGNIIITLPLASVGVGRIYNIKKIDGSNKTIKIICQPGEKIDDKNYKIIKVKYDSMQIQSDGSNWWIL